MFKRGILACIVAAACVCVPYTVAHAETTGTATGISTGGVEVTVNPSTGNTQITNGNTTINNQIVLPQEFIDAIIALGKLGEQKVIINNYYYYGTNNENNGTNNGTSNGSSISISDVNNTIQDLIIKIQTVGTEGLSEDEKKLIDTINNYYSIVKPDKKPSSGSTEDTKNEIEDTNNDTEFEGITDIQTIISVSDVKPSVTYEITVEEQTNTITDNKDTIENNFSKGSANGWYWLNNNWYYINDKKVHGGWVYYLADRNWYYLDTENGKMKDGWFTQEGNTYYLKTVSDGTRGSVQKGWQYIGDKWYLFDDNGVLQK